MANTWESDWAIPEFLSNVMHGNHDEGFLKFAQMYLHDLEPDPHPVETLLAKLNAREQDWERTFRIGQDQPAIFLKPKEKPWTREALECFVRWSLLEFRQADLGFDDEVDYATWILHFLGQACEEGRVGRLSPEPGKHILVDRFKEMYGIDMLHVRDTLRKLTAPRD